ncbi:hypothetical protein LAM21_23980, partial [Mycobacterium tuberculosis]|nr:hypothetical protein [Mycobacterium tuberculosis]
RTLDRILPQLEKNIGFKTFTPVGGVVQEDILLQSIKIFAPNEDGEKAINVIGNAYVPEAVKNIDPSDIIASISYFFNLLHSVG